MIYYESKAEPIIFTRLKLEKLNAKKLNTKIKYRLKGPNIYHNRHLYAKKVESLNVIRPFYIQLLIKRHRD